MSLIRFKAICIDELDIGEVMVRVALKSLKFTHSANLIKIFLLVKA